jgi:biotin carboxyl carrier protein
MYGRIVEIFVRENDRVRKGELLFTVDSMKIENNILAPRDAVISKVLKDPGSQVALNEIVLMIE